MTYNETYYQSYTDGSKSWSKALRKRTYLYDALLRIARKYCPNPHCVVEVGCGLGFFTSKIVAAWPKAHVHASDISEYAIEIARRALQEAPTVWLKVQDAQSLDSPPASADIVFAFDVVEHLREPERFVREAHKTLRPGGVLMLSTPNVGSLGYRLKTTAGTGVNEWFAYRDVTHISLRAISEWRTSLTAAGFMRLRDGTDFCWDTPYFGFVPLWLQKLVFNGSHHILTRLSGFMSWEYGENYYGVWGKP